MYSENGKKSIYFNNRTDIIIFISVFVLVISPVIFSSIFRLAAKSRQKDIYLSARCEELFGVKTMETLAQEFERQNPDFRVKLPNALSEKGREPDILFFDENEFNALAAEGVLLPFGSFSGEKTENQMQAAPLVFFMDLLFYNIELLRAAGFERPPKTGDEFLAYVKTINAADNGILADAAGAAMALGPENSQALSREIFSWIWAGGGNFRPNDDSSLSAPVINTKQIIGDFNFLRSLYREVVQTQTLSRDIFEITGEQVLESFAQGKTAMIIASTRTIPMFREKMGDGVFGITTIPGAGTAGKYSVSLSGIFAGINKNCVNQDAAAVFLEFLAAKSPLFCAQLKAVPGYLPDLQSGDNKNYIKEDLFYSKAWDIFEASTVIRGFLGVPGAQEYENAVREEIKSFFEDKRTAQETVKDIQKRWDEIFTRYAP